MAENRTGATEKVWDLIKDIRFAMLTTRDIEGRLQSRPMTTQGHRGDDNDYLYFFASRRSEAVADLQRDAVVNIAYADPGKDSYVSVSGNADVADDPARKKQLWSKFAEAWFPGGPQDPDLALIRIRIDQADYWDVKESKATQLFKMAKAAMTGHPPTGLGERGTVRN